MKTKKLLFLFVLMIFVFAAFSGCRSSHLSEEETKEEDTTYSSAFNHSEEEYDDRALEKAEKIIVPSENGVACEEDVLYYMKLSFDDYAEITLNEVIERLGMPNSYGGFSAVLSYIWKTDEGNEYSLGFYQIPKTAENKDHVLDQFLLTVGPAFVWEPEEYRSFLDRLISAKETDLPSEETVISFGASLQTKQTTLRDVLNVLGDPYSYGQPFTGSHVTYTWKTAEGKFYSIAFRGIPKSKDNRDDPDLRFEVSGGPVVQSA